MSAHPSQNSPWPAQTPAVASSSSRRVAKRRKVGGTSSSASTSKYARRQDVTDWSLVMEAETACQLTSGNEIISCFPTASTTIPQHQWASFVWNSRRPELTQTNLVNIYLFHGDSLTRLLTFPNVTNDPSQAGLITAQVNDTWWGDNGAAWNGANISYPFYWVITRNDVELDGTETRQAVFEAVQTTFADSIVASMASTSSVASASAASESASRSRSSQSAAAASGVTGSNAGGAVTGSPTSTAGVQSGASGSGFPHWAIAVIVVLGFLAIATTCILIFFIMRRIRRNELESNRNSMGSASPMMAHTGNSPGSPLLAQHAQERHSSIGHGGGVAPSVVSPDGASTISRAASAGDTGPFSGADAAIMADAFRKALRKPDFAGRPVEEGESPENHEGAKEELLSRELAEEGRDIRSVSSSRGVTVETMSDSGDTVQDHSHPH